MNTFFVQELTEQRHSGSNPDYGLPTPTLVSPPKGIKHSAAPKMGGMAPSNLEIALFKQYPFDSAVQRMTVVAKKKGAQYYSVFIKGAPEKVASFCRSETSKTKVLCLLRSSRAEYQNIVLQLIQSFLLSSGRVQQSASVLHQAGLQGHRRGPQDPQARDEVLRGGRA